MPVNLWTVGLAALITALATGLGAPPFFFVPRISRQGLSFAEILPHAIADASSHSVTVTLAITRMLIFQQLLPSRSGLLHE